MRLFVALDISAAVRERLASLLTLFQERSRQAPDRGPRWIRPENLHVTLKFIGEVPAARADSIRQALASVRSGSPVEMNFRGLGFFPEEKRPRVLWVGLHPSANLATLAADVDRAAATQGVPPETRAFAPHLTLARLEPPGLRETLRAAIQENAQRDFGSVSATEFHLIESKLQRAGALYTTLHSFCFAPEN